MCIFTPRYYVPINFHPSESEDERFEVYEEMTIDDGILDITIPRGFRFDGASTPGFIKWYITGTETWIMRGAAFHDYMYRKGLGNRTLADAVFFSCMTYDKAPVIKKWVAYLGVRLGGMFSYQGGS